MDLVLCRSGDSLVLSANVTDIFSDHFVVQCTLRISKPLLPLKKITFRPLKKIDIASFASDLAQLPVITDPASTCEALLEQYNTGVSQVLDKHAPLVSKSVVLRPVCPWFNDDVAEARRFCRRAERRWRLRKLTVDKEFCWRSGIPLQQKSEWLRLHIFVTRSQNVEMIEGRCSFSSTSSFRGSRTSSCLSTNRLRRLSMCWAPSSRQRFWTFGVDWTLPLLVTLRTFRLLLLGNSSVPFALFLPPR